MPDSQQPVQTPDRVNSREFCVINVSAKTDGLKQTLLTQTPKNAVVGYLTTHF